MPVKKPDKNEYEKEKSDLLKVQNENERRERYLSNLKKSPSFKKYVVKEIFEATLEKVYTLSNLPISDDMGKLGSIALQYKISHDALKEIIKRLK